MNVKEDTEVVVPSDHGRDHGYVIKTEEIEDTDASKDADEPIQDNSSENDDEYREPPVHTETFSERKRKSSAASSSDVSTTPRTRKKVKIAKDNSIQANTGFNEWCNQLLQFKEEFGHCNVPQRFANNPSLGRWCKTMRTAYKKIQKGTKTNSNLSQDRIERLEEIGFQWKG